MLRVNEAASVAAPDAGWCVQLTWTELPCVCRAFGGKSHLHHPGMQATHPPSWGFPKAWGLFCPITNGWK